MNMDPEVLVVIPTIVEHSKKYHLLDRLWHEPNVATVIVVDNGDCFGIPAKKQKQWSKVWHVRPGCNMNWLHSNNFGATIALERNIPFVCFMNDDVQLSKPFFPQMLKTFENHPDAGVVVPRYNGSFGDRANHPANPRHFEPEDADTAVKWVDGTCMMISQQTLRSVGLLDPCFRAPGWAADVDYSHRASEAGFGLYVSHRAMLWHFRGHGGLSATQVYGGRRAWVANGLKQAKEDLRTKYGPHWRDVLPLPRDAYGGKGG
jgi:GT2 family glycosyltransferase